MSRFLFLFFGGGFFINIICNLMLCVIFYFGYAEAESFRECLLGIAVGGIHCLL